MQHSPVSKRDKNRVYHTRVRYEMKTTPESFSFRRVGSRRFKTQATIHYPNHLQYTVRAIITNAGKNKGLTREKACVPIASPGVPSSLSACPPGFSPETITRPDGEVPFSTSTCMPSGPSCLRVCDAEFAHHEKRMSETEGVRGERRIAEKRGFT